MITDSSAAQCPLPATTEPRTGASEFPRYRYELNVSLLVQVGVSEAFSCSPLSFECWACQFV